MNNNKYAYDKKSISEEMIKNSDLLKKIADLYKTKDSSKADEIKYNICLNDAIKKFSYIVEMHTRKYKKYANYQDLYQEGLFGLALAISKFNPARSKNFFKIANWYIKTRIRRAANKYEVISVPMRFAKEKHFNRLIELPVMVDKALDPHEESESEQVTANIKQAISCLDEIHRTILCMYHGINNYNLPPEVICKKKTSLAVIAKHMNISRAYAERVLDEAYKELQVNPNITKYMNNNDSSEVASDV